jgi:hypothetical protein
MKYGRWKVFYRKYSGSETTLKQATKGAFLSGLVYPGTGQMFFSRIITGLFFISFTTIGLGVLIYRIARRIYLVFDQVLPQSGNIPLSFKKLIGLLNQTEYSSWDVELISLLVVACCWIISIVHAYFVGRRLDRPEISTGFAKTRST